MYMKTQKPKTPKLEVWDDYGTPVGRVPLTDSRWSFNGNWTTSPAGRRGSDSTSRVATDKDAEVTFSFEGTGAIVVGTYLPSGGKYDVYLDGKPDRTLDAYSDERGARAGESIWHGFGLKNGPHTVRLVVLGETYPGSTGTAVTVTDAVVFK